jgi:phosphoglycerol transferase MdoB-like AlkP superfamily enzyme
MSSLRLPVLLLRHYLFWLIVFFATRTIFLLWNREELAGIGFGETLAAYWHALYLDTATACYFLVFPFLFLLLSAVLKKEWPLKVNKWLTVVFLVCIFLITLGELPIYDEWHKKLDYKALWFLGNPSEVFHTASFAQLAGGIGGAAFLTWLFFLLYKKLAMPKEIPAVRPVWGTVAFGLLTPVALFTGIRGGYQPIPVQVSDAYYSKHNVLNLAAVNSTFNLVNNCIESSKADAPYRFMPPEEAAQVFAALNATAKDSTIYLLTTTRPNVVLVVLEGWSADLVKGCGGYDSITPNFDAMAKQGVLFTDCYASGSLSDQGMAAVFSAFPAQTKTSVITQPSKYVHLPCLNKSFKKAGYKTSFLFGGQLSYGNIKAYMYYNGFDRILEGEDFDPSIEQGKLGVHDEFLFARQLKELAKEPQPFFAAMFTLSSHGPFDFPMEDVLHWGDKEKPYINSVYYSDRSIGEFIAGAKKQPWYNNTLFVFVSDHSHNSPKNWDFNQPEYRRIPMLFYGEVIKPEYRGMTYDSVASQTDLAATLLAQLDIGAGEFRFSKNLLNPYSPNYAWYAFDEGFGLVKPEGRLTWHVQDGRIDHAEVATPAEQTLIVNQGKAFLQVLMEEYFNY